MDSKHSPFRIKVIGNLHHELRFTTSRASGPGGQNVNKVETKVTLYFDVLNSVVLTAEQKQVIIHRLAPRITREGLLVLSSQDKRSQFQNKENVIRKFDRVITKAFEKRKARKPTKPSKASTQKRLTSKKLRGEKKKWRQRP